MTLDIHIKTKFRKEEINERFGQEVLLSFSERIDKIDFAEEVGTILTLLRLG